MYKAEILADSISPSGSRLTTMKITFPRIMLAEMNTHRVFSRNSASSRAIPFKKMVRMVQENPFIPIAWQKDHKGMQGTEYFTSESTSVRSVMGQIFETDTPNMCKTDWLIARDEAIESATKLNRTGVTKQLCNRLLEPFMWHTIIVSSTEWENFFELRCPKYIIDGQTFRSKKDACKKFINLWENDWTDLQWLEKLDKSQADIHIQPIAELMWDAYNESKPKELKPGEWHIPFGDNIRPILNQHPDKEGKTLEELKLMIATARCARISYETLGDDPKVDFKADIRLYDILLESKHMSPFEHCAVATENSVSYNNFKGWIQHRYFIENKI